MNERSDQELSDEYWSDYGSCRDHALATPLWVENGVLLRCITDFNETDNWFQVGRLEQ